jgi:protein TonB
VGGSVPSPQKLVDVKPTVPPEWLRQGNGMEGVVALDLTIGEDGRVRDAVVTHSIPALDRAALDVVRQWQYAPTVVNGKALAVILPVQVSFPSRIVAPPAPAALTIRLTSLRRQDGEWTVWDIPVTRAAALPRWNLDADVPLPITEAARIGRAWLQQQNPQMRMETQSVTLTRIRRSADVDFWYYQIDCFGYASGPQPSGPLMKAVVLPDRSVLEPARTEPDSPPAGPYRAGPGVIMPRLLHDVRPEYTSDALVRKISGAVFVQGVVGTDGALHDLQVVRSLDAVYGLDQQALKAAAQWRFEPGTKDGQPVPVVVTIELTFTLKR